MEPTYGEWIHVSDDKFRVRFCVQTDAGPFLRPHVIWRVAKQLPNGEHGEWHDNVIPVALPLDLCTPEQTEAHIRDSLIRLAHRNQLEAIVLPEYRDRVKYGLRLTITEE